MTAGDLGFSPCGVKQTGFAEARVLVHRMNAARLKSCPDTTEPRRLKPLPCSGTLTPFDCAQGRLCRTGWPTLFESPQMRLPHPFALFAKGGRPRLWTFMGFPEPSTGFLDYADRFTIRSARNDRLSEGAPSLSRLFWRDRAGILTSRPQPAVKVEIPTLPQRAREGWGTLQVAARACGERRLRPRENVRCFVHPLRKLVGQQHLFHDRYCRFEFHDS